MGILFYSFSFHSHFSQLFKHGYVRTHTVLEVTIEFIKHHLQLIFSSVLINSF